MLFGSRKLYEETSALKRGSSTLSPCMDAMRRKVSHEYGIHVLNVYYDTIKNGPAEERPRLNLIVEFPEDEKRIRKDRLTRINPDSERRIVKAFSELVRKMNLNDEFKADNILVTVDTFSEEAMHQAAEGLFRIEEKPLIQRFSEERLWRITGISKHVVVFFIDEAAKRAAEAGDGRERISQACYEAVKRYDEFNYVTPANFSIRYDTKENLDKKFEGSLFYYFR